MIGRIATVACLIALVSSCSNDRPAVARTPEGDAARGGAAGSASSPVTPDSALRAIEDDYARAAAQRAVFRQRKGDLTDMSVEGGEFTAYFDQDHVVLVDAVLYGEAGKLELSVLYDEQGEARYVDRTESHYDRPFGDVVQTHRTRLYAQGGAALRLTDGPHEIDASQPSHKAQAQQLALLAREIGAVARRP